jgi:3-methyl-2-oxobutanoate hydroxymethyltransferase
MQAERVAGFKDFVEDVRSGGFPAKEHIIQAPDGLMDEFVKFADSFE